MANVAGLRIDFEDFKDVIDTAQVEGLDIELASKANLTHTHSKAQITDFGHSHSKTEIIGLDVELGGKADAIHNHDTEYYKKNYIDNAIDSLTNSLQIEETARISEDADLQLQINQLTNKSFLDLTDTPNNYAGSALKLVRVNSLGQALEFVSLSAFGGFLEVGDIIPKFRDIPAASAGDPWMDISQTQDVDCVHWPELQPLLWNVKLSYNAIDEFLVTGVIKGSGSDVYLEFANLPENLTLLDSLLEDLFFDGYNYTTGNSSYNYTTWGMCIEIPAMGPLAAGRYSITEVNNLPNIRRLRIDHPSIASTQAVTEYVSFYPFRKKDTDTICQWRQTSDATLRSANVQWLRAPDRLQVHWHDIYSNTGPNAGYGISNTAGDNTTGYNANAFKAKDMVSDGNGDPRKGKTTRDRGLAVKFYMFGGIYQ